MFSVYICKLLHLYPKLVDFCCIYCRISIHWNDNFDNIFIRFGTKLYRQTTGIPMGTNCAPLVADLFLFCYERDFMKSLSRENQADIIEVFNSFSRYLVDLLNIDTDKSMLACTVL